MGESCGTQGVAHK